MPLRADSESVHERDHSTFRVHWSVVATPMSARGVDPRSNLTVGPEIPDTTPARYQSVLDASARAARHLTWSDRTARGRWLAALADRLEASQAQLVTLADQETALGQPRLEGELRRTTSQLRLFADVVRDGGYLQATWDRPDPSTTPPRPDLRSFGLPIGPVAIWPASNFPFAFGNLGTDTASALAAGCPVLVKSSGPPRDVIGSRRNRARRPLRRRRAGRHLRRSAWRGRRKNPCQRFAGSSRGVHRIDPSRPTPVRSGVSTGCSYPVLRRDGQHQPRLCPPEGRR